MISLRILGLAIGYVSAILLICRIVADRRAARKGVQSGSGE